MKSILLGTAAALAASGAYAADLPGEAAPAAVDYVKVCDAFGAGYFSIPGTDTCLRIIGRVRAWVAYDKIEGKDGTAIFNTTANIKFDSKSATDYGTLKTYLEFEFNPRTSNFAAKNAYIKLGSVTVGMQDDLMSGDNLFNNNTGFTDFVGWSGDDQYGGVTIKAENLGGGFYAGIGGGAFVASVDKTALNGDNSLATLQAAVGIAKQSWGSAELSAAYFSIGDNNRANTSYATAGAAFGADEYALRALANFTVTSELTATVFGGYNKVQHLDGASYVGATAMYQVSKTVDVFAGAEYAFLDGSLDNNFAANVGGDYTIVPGLKLQPELDYIKYNKAGLSDVTAWLRLQREY
jgi:hypothetical protein